MRRNLVIWLLGVSIALTACAIVLDAYYTFVPQV